MEMEQRVGRVHRFLSRQTVIVDTVVVSHSREVDAYRVARAKLAEISRTLVPPDRFEGLFSRVMALVPPDQLQGLLVEQPLGPLSDDEQTRLTALVTNGFEQWRAFHAQYADQRKSIGALAAGEARWGDLRRFAELLLRAKPASGFSALRFDESDGEVREHPEAADVLEIDGAAYSYGDYGGMPVLDPGGNAVLKLGLNTTVLASRLREAGLPDRPTGAAHVRWPAGRELPCVGIKRPFGILFLARQGLRHNDGGWVEVGAKMSAWITQGEGALRKLQDEEMANAVRGLLDATVRLEPAEEPALVEAMAISEASLVSDLRRPSEQEREHRILHAVTPLFAGVIA
jgi:hypothetical protein